MGAHASLTMSSFSISIHLYEELQQRYFVISIRLSSDYLNPLFNVAILKNSQKPKTGSSRIFIKNIHAY